MKSPPTAERQRILIVEDVRALSIAYAEQLEDAGYTVTVAATVAAASDALANDPTIAAAVLDLHLPDADGLELLRSGQCDHLPVLVVTDDASIARAVEAMRLGALDYLVKPLSLLRLVDAVNQAVISGLEGLAARRTNWARPVSQRPQPPFIGESPAMVRVFHLIDQVADSGATVMITGETGTGKELCAERLHRQSRRASGPFIAINCGAIPDNLLESELFGHVKGAFTGAVANRTGAVKSADGGTLFLDEVCEMPLHLQVKLLRFLQSGTIQPLGASRSSRVDVRVVCATNRNPREEVAAGRFRDDLYFRLAVIPVEMPPLRDRAGDIDRLADAFLDLFSRELGRPRKSIPPAFRAALHGYHWPGNVRELQNAMLRAILLSDGPELQVRTLQLAADGEGAAAPSGSAPAAAFSASAATLAATERQAIEHAMRMAEGNVALAAQSLGISVSTIYRKLKSYSD